MDSSPDPQRRGTRQDLYPAQPPQESPPAEGGSAAPVTRRTGRSPRRRHPANGTRAAALALSIATTGGLAYALAALEQDSGADLATTGATPTTPMASVTAGGSPTAVDDPPTTIVPTPTTVAPTPNPTPTAAVATEVAYVGESVSTRWGPVQVEGTVVDGQLVEVVAIQIPDGDRRSTAISESAEPKLRSVALASQSAEVDTVSGATYTSRAYSESLQSVIDQAAVDGIVIGLP